MTVATVIVGILGALGTAALIVWSGAEGVGAALASAGWGAGLVVAARAVVVIAAGLGWQVIFPKSVRPRLAVSILVRLVREAINTLLPLTQVGGEFVAARLLTFFGVGAAAAGASLIVDLMVQAGTQFVFALVGLVLLVALGGDATVIRIVAIGLAFALPALAGFYAVQRHWGRRILLALLGRLRTERHGRAVGAVDALYEWLRTFHGRRAALAGATAIHLAAWLAGAAEVWIALAFMGHPVTWAEAVVIESLSQAVRAAAFAVPAALGVQEGGFVILGALFGVPAEAALALSLVKRVADLAVGAPGLLAWQALEGRRLVHRRRRRRAARGEPGRHRPP
jgi:putative membrane protein